MKIWLLTREIALRRTAPAALIQRASQRGVDLRVIFPERCVSCLSSSGLEIHLDGVPLPLPDGAINYLAAAGNHLAFTLARQLEALGVTFINPAQAMLLGRDKASSLQVFAAAGLPVPKTTLQSLSMGTPLEFPIVVKAAVGSQGQEVFLCRDQAEYDDALVQVEKSRGGGQAVLLQEYIRTSPARDLRVYVVGGQVIGVVLREGAPGDWKANLATGGRGLERPVDDEIVRLSVDACRLLGLDLAGVDLLMGPEGYLLSEVNPAPLFRVSEEGAPRSFDVPDHIFDWFERRLGPR